MHLMHEHKEAGMYKNALFRFFVKKLLNLAFHFYFMTAFNFKYIMFNIRQNMYY